MNLKDRAWKYTTAIVVVLIILNPEMTGLALFIDAIGLDIFLMLFEVQILAMLMAISSIKVIPVLLHIKHFLTYSWQGLKKDPQTLLFAVPGQAALMHLLVFSVAIGIALNACQ